MFAVIAEEYGIITCLVLVGLVAFLLLRALARALSAQDAFRRNAIAGLALSFALQAGINMAVNVGILPAKGMTLPFISYGGSSILGLSLAMGFLIALARREPSAR
jgi:cell division protein FtsW